MGSICCESPGFDLFWAGQWSSRVSVVCLGLASGSGLWVCNGSRQ